jgi:hypothetical protein
MHHRKVQQDMPMSPCGESVGAACKEPGQCCDERIGRCVTGPAACLVARPVRGKYDGPPGVLPDPYGMLGDGDRPHVCPEKLRCGSGANATCPWSPFGPDLCCVQDTRQTASEFDGKCVPCDRADANRRAILWDGRWLFY